MPLRPAAPVTRPTTGPPAGSIISSFKGFDGNPALARILGAQALREINHQEADTLTEAAGQARHGGGEADERAYFW